MTSVYIAAGHSVRPEFRMGLPTATPEIPASFDPVLLIARGDGARWEISDALAGKAVQCLASDPLRPERIYCGTQDDGLWISADAGRTWQPAGPGIASAVITAVTVAAPETTDGNSVVYAGTEPSAIWRSVDGGATWQAEADMTTLPSAPEWSFPPRPQTHHVRWIGIDPRDSARQYACVEQGAFLRTFDGGATWEERRPEAPRDTHTLATHALAPGRLYSAAGDGLWRPGYGYVESRDSGESWIPAGEGLAHQYGYGMAVDPGDPNTVVLSAARSPWEAHNPRAAESAIYFRSAGIPWRQATVGLPPARGTVIPILAANAAEPGVFYAACNHGLFRSADGGETWLELPLAWRETFRFGHVHGLVVTSDA